MSGSGSLHTTSGSSVAARPGRRLVVLDAWPVTQWFRGRSLGGNEFKELLRQAARGHVSLCMSRLNLGEIYYRTAKDFSKQDAAVLVERLKALPIEVVSLTDADVDEAALLKGDYNISYADAFAAVLCMRRSGTLMSGDPDFKGLAAAGLLQLEWVGA